MGRKCKKRKRILNNEKSSSTKTEIYNSTKSEMAILDEKFVIDNGALKNKVIEVVDLEALSPAPGEQINLCEDIIHVVDSDSDNNNSSANYKATNIYNGEVLGGTKENEGTAIHFPNDEVIVLEERVLRTPGCTDGIKKSTAAYQLKNIRHIETIDFNRNQGDVFQAQSQRLGCNLNDNNSTFVNTAQQPKHEQINMGCGFNCRASLCKNRMKAVNQIKASKFQKRKIASVILKLRDRIQNIDHGTVVQGGQPETTANSSLVAQSAKILPQVWARTHLAPVCLDIRRPSTNDGTNIFNPDPMSKQPHGSLRPIVIDACNVAVGHGKTHFSSRGLAICVDYFLRRGHKVKAFMPRSWKSNGATTDRHILAKLENQGHLIITPSRRVRGKLIVPYDDRYIVQYANEVGGVIVTTDNYRDLMSENQAWRETIEERLLMFTWADDILMFPCDPLGRRGPKLKEFLKFP